MYTSYGLYFLKHFVVALTKVCTVKLAQLHHLMRFKSARVIVWPAGDSTILRTNMLSILLDNSFIELPESKLKTWEKHELI